MKISFLGLSCFLLENKSNSRILIDPFSDDSAHSLGVKFPKKLNGKLIKSELTLFSHLDTDHYSFRPEIG
jgi:L-ascorbate metabolism protein UlaG (beta-lactamase superfamily)